MSESVNNGRVYGAEGGEILEPLQEIPDQVIDPWCDSCYDETGLKVEIVGFCPDCNSFLCKPCMEAHSKMQASRNHRIKRGSRMPRCQDEKPIMYPHCHIHVGNMNDHFCLDHGVARCSQCIQEAHTLCGTGTVSDLCKTIGLADVSNFREIVSSIHNNLVSTNSALETNINDIKNTRNRMIKEIQDLRDKIIAQIQERYSEIISKINDVSSQTLSYISDQVLLLSDMSHWFDKTISDIDKKIKAKFEPNLFIRIQEIARNVGRCKTELDDISKQLKKAELSFSVGTEVSAFLSCNCQLGELTEESKQIDILKPMPEIAFPQLFNVSKTTGALRKHNISQISATKSGNINIRLAEDKLSCDVYGMDMTTDGILLLADFKNKKIKAISPDNKLLSFLTLSDSPTDVSILNRLTAAAGTNDGKLNMINISDLDAISVQRTIDLGYRITGILRYNTNIVAAMWGEQNGVHMLNRNGEEIWSITTDTKEQNLYQSPFAVACKAINDKATIIVTDWGKNTLSLLDASNGKFISTIDVEGKGPLGLTVDNHGNVYVCNFYTKEICVWSADLQQCKILLSGDKLQCEPRTVLYSGATDTLYVSYFNNKDTLDCFQLRFK